MGEYFILSFACLHVFSFSSLIHTDSKMFDRLNVLVEDFWHLPDEIQMVLDL